MNCSETALLLDEYSTGELTDVDAAAVDDHLNGCPTCRFSLRQIVVIGDRIRALPSEAVAEDFLPRLRTTLSRVRPGLISAQTAPVAFLPEDTCVDEDLDATDAQLVFLRCTRVAA